MESRGSGRVKCYLSGFDIYASDAMERGFKLKRLCLAHNMLALYPGDNRAPLELPRHEAAQWLTFRNLNLLRQADCVLANLNDFRGGEPAPNVCFEVGMAVALGKPVWGYCSDLRAITDKLPSENGRCDKGFELESFNLPHNKMIACTWSGVSMRVDDAVASLATHMAKRGKRPEPTFRAPADLDMMMLTRVS